MKIFNTYSWIYKIDVMWEVHIRSFCFELLQHFQYGKEIVQTTTTYIGLYGLPSCNRLMRYYKLACAKASVARNFLTQWPEYVIKLLIKPLVLELVYNSVLKTEAPHGAYGSESRLGDKQICTFTIYFVYLRVNKR